MAQSTRRKESADVIDKCPPPRGNTSAMTDVLDCKGLQCPLPVLRARKALAALAAGAVLTVEANDPMSAIDMPHFCAEAGHELVAAAARDGVYTFTIRKSRAAAP